VQLLIPSINVHPRVAPWSAAVEISTTRQRPTPTEWRWRPPTPART